MSLINPNQLRHFGLTVSDDPTDSAREFGIVGNDFCVPIEISGTTVSFKSRVPTRWEMQNCQIIEVTADEPWNPSEVAIATLTARHDETLEEAILSNIRAVEAVRQPDNPCTCRPDLCVHDPTWMIWSMVSAVHVATAHRDKVSVAYVGAKDRHSRVTPETVARKFRCGLETAQRTLKTTTQRGVRHSLHPLHRRIE